MGRKRCFGRGPGFPTFPPGDRDYPAGSSSSRLDGMAQNSILDPFNRIPTGFLGRGRAAGTPVPGAFSRVAGWCLDPGTSAR